MIQKQQENAHPYNRRDILKYGLSAGALLTINPGFTASKTASGKSLKPNILVILTDQQHINTIRAAGCSDINTPALDELYQSGASFNNSYCTNPVCIPSRSSLLTGRMPTETGMWFNSARAGQVEKAIPNVGQWLEEKAGYDTVYAGKWHIPHCHTYDIPGFNVLASGSGHWGETSDDIVSQACSQYLLNRNSAKPFMMFCSFLQPHDICVWLSLNMNNRDVLIYPEIQGQLPKLPDNFHYDTLESPVHKALRKSQQPACGKWSQLQWRYYLWAYYRHIEMVDAQIERVLEALQQSKYSDNTIIIFTSDHGEGMAEHQMVRKGFLYDSCTKVPLIISSPGKIKQAKLDTLVSGVDILPTICDYAGIEPPDKMVGQSMKQLLEGESSDLQRPLGDFIVTEKGSTKKDIDQTGRMVRSRRYKYIKYYGDEKQQFFDMQKDPGETKNLINDPSVAAVIAEHRQMLKRWEQGLKLSPRVIKAGGDQWKQI